MHINRLPPPFFLTGSVNQLSPGIFRWNHVVEESVCQLTYHCSIFWGLRIKGLILYSRNPTNVLYTKTRFNSLEIVSLTTRLTKHNYSILFPRAWSHFHIRSFIARQFIDFIYLCPRLPLPYPLFRLSRGHDPGNDTGDLAPPKRGRSHQFDETVRR